ncbi:MAG: phosphatidate cytidylyltransferase [Hyphomicrobiaceae bacterium]|nr:MAG: phosphatidate cytidylyltransferase [Hyphomicrobiaceae bacterium]
MNEHDMADEGAGERHDPASRLGGDFRTRLLSGLAMGAIAALFVFTGAIPFTVLVVAIAVLLSWEWGRLVHGRDVDVVMVIHIGAACAAAVLAAFGYAGLGLLVLPIGAILVMLLSLGSNSVYSAFGVFYTGLPAVAMIWLRSDAVMGLLAVVFLIVVSITADTGAFVAGRLLGGPRLWPQVSPNKTWAGLVGALVACAVVGALFWFAVPESSAVRLAGTAAFLSFVAQLGDLAESALKRRFGAKDASALIPGHGGVMDRVDGLIAVAAAAGLIGLALDVHYPARALLLGP